MCLSIRLLAEEKRIAECLTRKCVVCRLKRHLSRRFLSELKMSMMLLWLLQRMQSTK